MGFHCVGESVLNDTSRNNNNLIDCRTFRPCRPLSTAYKTVLYAVDEGPMGSKHPAIKLLRIYSTTYCSRLICLGFYCLVTHGRLSTGTRSCVPRMAQHISSGEPVSSAFPCNVRQLLANPFFFKRVCRDLGSYSDLLEDLLEVSKFLKVIADGHS